MHTKRDSSMPPHLFPSLLYSALLPASFPSRLPPLLPLPLFFLSLSLTLSSLSHLLPFCLPSLIFTHIFPSSVTLILFISVPSPLQLSYNISLRLCSFVLSSSHPFFLFPPSLWVAPFCFRNRSDFLCLSLLFLLEGNIYLKHLSEYRKSIIVPANEWPELMQFNMLVLRVRKRGEIPEFAFREFRSWALESE